MRKQTMLRSIYGRAIALVATLSVISALQSAAQQGSTGVLPTQVRIPNDSTSSGSLIRNANGMLVAVYVSQATNLVQSGRPNAVYLEDLATGQILTIMQPSANLVPLSAKAIRVDNSTLVAVHVRVNNSSDAIAVASSADNQNFQWRYYDVRGELLAYALSPNGEVIAVSQASIYYIERFPIQGSRETLASGIYRLSDVSISVADDGAAYVISAYRNLGSQLTPWSYVGVRLHLTGEYQPWGSTELSDYFVLNHEGTHLISRRGEVYRIRRTYDEQDDRTGFALNLEYTVTSIAQSPSPVIVDFTDNLIFYATHGGKFLRLYNTRSRVDIPIGGSEVIPLRTANRSIEGERVIFSTRSALVGWDNNQHFDLYVYNTSTNTYEPVTASVRFPKGGSTSIAVGSNPNLIAFVSNNRFTPDKTTPHYDVFVWVNGQLRRVRGAHEPNESSFDVRVNRDRNTTNPLVVFASYATNLVGTNANGVSNIFLYAPLTGQVSQVTIGFDGDSYSPWISPLGIVFISQATNRGAPAGQVYFYNTSRGSFSVISMLPSGSYLEGVNSVAVSPSGHFVALSTDNALFRYQWLSHVSNYVFQGRVDVPSAHVTDVSDDGTVVFTTDARLLSVDQNNSSDVYCWDYSNRLSLVSRTATGVAAGNSRDGSISANGRYVSFVSDSDMIVPLDINSDSDVFVLDRVLNHLYCASRTPQGITAGGGESRIAASGTHVVFTTTSELLTNSFPQDGVNIVIHAIGCTPPGDVDLNGIVEDADLLAVLTRFGNTNPSLADVDANGVIDDNDLLIVLYNFGSSCRFGLAGGEEDAKESDGKFEIGRLSDGSAYIYFTSHPRFLDAYDLEEQHRDIELALQGDWPYPVAGGMFHVWKEYIANPHYMDTSERAELYRWMRGSTGSDFQPASGTSWQFPLENLQLRYETSAVKFALTPFARMVYNNWGTQFMVQAGLRIDFYLFGFGRDNAASAKFEAGRFSESTAGYRIDIRLNDNPFRFPGWEKVEQIPTNGWSTAITKMVGTGEEFQKPPLFSFSKTFVVFTIPVNISFTLDAYAGYTAQASCSISPPRAGASFTPTAGLKGRLSGAVGFKIFGIQVNLAELRLTMQPIAQLSVPTQVTANLLNNSGRLQLKIDGDSKINLTALKGQLKVGLSTSCIRQVTCVKYEEGKPAPHISGTFPAAWCCVSGGCARSGRCPRKVEAFTTIINIRGLEYNLARLFQGSWTINL